MVISISLLASADLMNRLFRIAYRNSGSVKVLGYPSFKLIHYLPNSTRDMSRTKIPLFLADISVDIEGPIALIKNEIKILYWRMFVGGFEITNDRISFDPSLIAKTK